MQPTALSYKLSQSNVKWDIKKEKDSLAVSVISDKTSKKDGCGGCSGNESGSAAKTVGISLWYQQWQ